MKATDYIAKKLLESGCNTAYAVTGGAAVHILDSFEREGGNIVFFHHEQSASLAVGSHFKSCEKLATCVVTSGPGVTNAITGLVACWLDSVPSIFLSGQSRLSSLIGDRTGVRQRGNQEVETKKLVQHHCKKFFQPSTPEELLSVIDEALYFCFSGRPGPVWIDFPLDLQWADLDLEDADLKSSQFKSKKPNIEILDSNELYLDTLIEDLEKYKKPIILLGTGVTISGSRDIANECLKNLDIPILTTWGAIGIVDEISEKYVGRPGPLGNRAANIILLESDLIIAIGTHLRSQIIGPTGIEDLSDKKIYTIHIDENEDKYIELKNKKFIKADSKLFLNEFNEALKSNNIIEKPEWKKYSNKVKKLEQIKTKLVESKGTIDPYKLFEYITYNFYDRCHYVVDGGGTVTQMGMQSIKTARNQHVILSNGLTLMGSGLPEAIGSYQACKKPVILLIGEGSLQFNIQELATIKYHQMKIIILVIDNGGYLSIQNTQKQFLEGRSLGTSNNSGLCFPSIEFIAKSYGLEFESISSEDDFHLIENTFNSSKPTLIDVKSNRERMVEPRVAFQYSEKLKRNITLPLSKMDPQIDTKFILD